MRNGQNNNKRMRGRNNNNRGGGGGGGGNKGHHHSNPLTRVYESNGPEVKIRGTAHHVAEKYLQLARDASSSGDPVTAENFYQHAEHYLRLIATAQEQFRQQNPSYQAPPSPTGDDRNDGSDDDGDDQPSLSQGQPQAPQNSGYQQNGAQQNGSSQQPSYGQQHNNRPQQHQPRAPQPYQQQPQPYQQPQPQPYQQPQNLAAQPQPAGEDSDHQRLPSFITGGQPATAPATRDEDDASGQEVGANGERFPMHRRRRRGRSSGPRPEGGSGAQPEFRPASNDGSGD